MDSYALIHWGPNTFTGEEWGHGTEDPNIFNPQQFDPDQWCRVLKDAGLEGLVMVAKHHDGFCLWPSRYSTHTVRESKWRGGKGDVLREVSDACRRHGLKFGVYLSPWDRNHPSYGTGAKYNEVYVRTAQELMESYGPFFMFWMDGANGEGPNGKKQVYDFPMFWSAIRQGAPEANIFSDVGPDVRWVGNEAGYADETNWATLNIAGLNPGNSVAPKVNPGGEKGGSHWIPAECDVPLRKGWFWRESERGSAKSLAKLADIYFASVGRNSALDLGIAPDDRGLIADDDVERLREFGAWRRASFTKDYADGAQIAATSTHGPGYGAANALSDGGFWCAEDGRDAATLTLTWPKPVTINCLRLEEQIALGQRIEEVEIHGLAKATTVGAKRLIRFPETTTDELTITVRSSLGAPTLKRLQAFRVVPMD